ncbi:hypothetical protein OESDEN_24667 [Oesophagostomum dentatum]|uniref:CHCH domain-containing protein n=2 Tax=Strongylidae TaxID=27830 RepID=A0A0B1RWZ5_OESDE|nr:hypothetical protein OESDEN_24667 [Oesophagostomum dentatum]
MFLSSPLLKESALARGKSVYPKVTVFSEILPLASKNHSNAKRGRPAASSCTQELQALFSCLKKWEFDDKPCGKQHSAYMDCVHESERALQEYKEAATKVCPLAILVQKFYRFYIFYSCFVLIKIISLSLFVLIC